MPGPAGYSRLQILLHWFVAILIALQFLFHDYISEAWEAVEHGREFVFHPLVAQHVFGGLLIALLVVWRLVVRVRRGVPPPPDEEPPLLKLAAHAAHWSFYALMLALPLTGAVAWFGVIEASAEIHEFLRLVLLALIAVHVVAAFYHHFILKTDVLLRMKRAAN